MFARDLSRLRCLPAFQLATAAESGSPIYGFLIKHVQSGPDGTLIAFTVARSGITVEVWQSGRVTPARKAS
jgi:hypothetical protein